ncbi:hypothetical protein Nepgr_030016 [Nepenthes gracilis]|uniref:NB-ARC domain-containing protein n=1 Tax=Nepenthes gracilis TaxID=150966 RepID=A0AAD3TDP2_NEPGR|nr:hypothetical protein Nepgr_030016 [Nepenthes gracilis]
MGGSGKTTLARKLYNHKTIKQHFNCQAWVSISQEWNPQHILVEILRQAAGITQKTDEMVSIEGLVDKLRDYLKHKLYLIVLDDVWKKDALEDMLPAFPFENRGSKIIITTRIHEVVEFPDLPHFFHEPRHLTKDESWELFSKIALNHRECIDDYQQIGDFEKLGKEMLKKCEGLPLAIIALGGLLGAKGTTEEWEKVSKVVSSKVMGGRGTHTYGTVKDMLALSYHDLPYDLKPCFLYVALFPEDCEIPISMLTNMWIAEGFIMSQEETLEEAARQCLDELIQRCVVQVATSNYAGKVKTIRIHDLMRDLCIKKAKEQNFLEVFHRSSAPLELDEDATRSQSRRCIIHSYSSISVQIGTQNSHLRSLFIFGVAKVTFYCYELRATLSWEQVYKNFRLLRVLNISSSKTFDGTLPAEIGNLIHLRYLGIRGTNIIELPESIENLRNLLTLDYKSVVYFGRYEVRVPNVLWKLERLRHVFLPYDMICTTGLKLSTLKSLQTLCVVWGKNWMLNEMFTLSSSVKRLRIQGISSKEQLMAVFQCQSVTLDQLYSLHINWISCDENVKLQNLELLCHCNHLRKLKLYGRIGEESLPIQFPSKLKKKRLVYTHLTLPETMKNLGRLANLKYISLSTESYVGIEWTCRAGEFPQLEQLIIERLRNLEEWWVERGAMPHLTSLRIQQCKKLKKLPEGLKFIGSLRRLHIAYMSEAFYRWLNHEENNGEITGQGGEDLHIIRHIPTVTIMPQNWRDLSVGDE